MIVITDTSFTSGEAEAITGLLDIGVWRVHVRKPGADEAEVAHLLEEISPKYRNRISLHDCHPLARIYGVGGVHLNGRAPLPPEDFSGLVSRSCHSLEELSEYKDSCDYMFLSPVFDSISKQGYKSRFTLEEIRAFSDKNSLHEKVLALGGVTPDNAGLLLEAGFGGVAVLGYIWKPFLNDRNVSALLSRAHDFDRFIHIQFCPETENQY